MLALQQPSVGRRNGLVRPIGHIKISRLTARNCRARPDCGRARTTTAAVEKLAACSGRIIPAAAHTQCGSGRPSARPPASPPGTARALAGGVASAGRTGPGGAAPARDAPVRTRRRSRASRTAPPARGPLFPAAAHAQCRLEPLVCSESGRTVLRTRPTKQRPKPAHATSSWPAGPLPLLHAGGLQPPAEAGRAGAQIAAAGAPLYAPPPPRPAPLRWPAARAEAVAPRQRPLQCSFAAGGRGRAGAGRAGARIAAVTARERGRGKGRERGRGRGRGRGSGRGRGRGRGRG